MPTINLSTTDLAVMAIYLVIIVAWGIRHSSRGSEEGYFLGGRGMSWPLIGLSMMAMCVSSSSLVGWSGDAYDTGIVVFNYGIAGAILPILFFMVFFLPFYLRNRIFTLPEFLEGRYDSRSRYYLSSITIIGYTFADAAVTLYAGGLMVQLAFPGADLSTVIWGIAILAASYTLIGGLSAVMWVDMIQSVVLFIGSIILAKSPAEVLCVSRQMLIPKGFARRLSLFGIRKTMKLIPLSAQCLLVGLLATAQAVILIDYRFDSLANDVGPAVQVIDNDVDTLVAGSANTSTGLIQSGERDLAASPHSHAIGLPT